MTKLKTLQKESAKRFNKRFNYANFTWNGDNETGLKSAKKQLKSVKSFIHSEQERVWKTAEEETAKAFGGCRLCYGKGYATSKRQYEGARGRIFGELDPYIPCSCDRGKQIVEMKNLLQEEITKEK